MLYRENYYRTEKDILKYVLITIRLKKFAKKQCKIGWESLPYEHYRKNKKNKRKR